MLRMNRRYRRLFWMLLIAVNLTAAGTAFYLYTSGKDYSVSQKERAHFIGLSYMTMNNEFYKIISEGIF